ncbi:MAG: hypothetical protein EZS28_029044 [Streblomastix strix]|uniref:Uncharacterized protein n=1 Tax=Streblomastix strix TaxID=222440 RepID=A0A5J4UY53_9EUKA|nr:MAG: hypothetical protein EZS28_029044 [Streblomastix strix]
MVQDRWSKKDGLSVKQLNIEEIVISELHYEQVRCQLPFALLVPKHLTNDLSCFIAHRTAKRYYLKNIDVSFDVYVAVVLYSVHGRSFPSDSYCYITGQLQKKP